MKHWTPIALLFLLACAAAPGHGQSQDASENPYRTAKVGDFVGYKWNNSVRGTEIDGAMKISVIAKSESTATIKTTATFRRFEVADQEDTIRLNKPFDINQVIQLLGERNAKFTRSAEGTSRISVGGRTYDATWITGKATVQNGNVIVEADVKVWFSKAIPLSGLLRMESKRRGGSMVLELYEHGNGK